MSETKCLCPGELEQNRACGQERWPFIHKEAESCADLELDDSSADALLNNCEGHAGAMLGPSF